MKTLQTISTAYRATAEEQDDTILWLTQAMTNAGGSFTVLLDGLAVNYAITEQNASGLKIGSWHQTQPPQIVRDIERTIASGTEVYLLEDDLNELGLSDKPRVSGTRRLMRSDLPIFLDNFDRIWCW